MLPPPVCVPPTWEAICSIYPSADDFVIRLEQLRWGRKPRCPYCNSLASSRIKATFRHHCNSCHTSFSVFVRTIMHKTRLDPRKWGLVSIMLLSQHQVPSVADIAAILEVNANTASRIGRCVRSMTGESLGFFEKMHSQILEDARVKARRPA